MKYDVDFYKTDNLTPDEMNRMRSNAKGIWLFCGTVTANNPTHATVVARRKQRQQGWIGSGCKLRAKPFVR